MGKGTKKMNLWKIISLALKTGLLSDVVALLEAILRYSRKMSTLSELLMAIGKFLEAIGIGDKIEIVHKDL